MGLNVSLLLTLKKSLVIKKNLIIIYNSVKYVLSSITLRRRNYEKISVLLFYCFIALTVLLLSVSVGYAGNPILESLNTQGMNVEALDDSFLGTIRGGAVEVIWNQPTPSVVYGLRSHHVTYKGFGSETDYRSYNYVGSEYSPKDYTYEYNGAYYRVGGDQWLADLTSDPNSWNSAYAVRAEYHLQILDPVTKQPTNAAFRDSAWNRPITTFSW